MTTSPKYPVHLYAGCPCFKCDQPFEEIDGFKLIIRMSLCPECGNKRCPGAMNHENHTKEDDHAQ